MTQNGSFHEDWFGGNILEIFYNEDGHARTPPTCIVGSSDIVLRVGTDVGVDVVVGIEFCDHSLDAEDVLSV